MDLKELHAILTIGETAAVEFKRCGNGMESDTYETVCSFLNRFGGDIFMGVQDDGTVVGVPEKAAPDMVKNFISVISNPALFSPTIYLTPEIIRDEQGHSIIHVHIPPSAEVHSYKKVVYDRVDDADVKVTATGAIAQMYIRKQNIFTEKKIYPYARMDDLRLDLLPKIRIMAQNHAGGQHPWTSLNDQELLKSAGLYGRDIATGEEGYNLAAIMLLGKDDVILNVAPTYVTDALVRKVNVDRYDDREIIKTNLIESYYQLLEFGRKNLPDKFFLEDTVNKSLRNTIVREMVSNTLMHREFSSSYTAKFVIEKERMYVENASRASKEGVITVENLEPNPKNPTIAAFFRNIGYADQLGSGVRKLFKYSKFYSGKDPKFVEGDVFRIIVPLDEMYSFDYSQNLLGATKENISETLGDKGATLECDFETLENHFETKEIVSREEEKILLLIKENPFITQQELKKKTGISLGTIKRILPRLQEKNVLVREGGKRFGKWLINTDKENRERHGQI
ncbi:MAG: putative DNA binding domain-containing protein [Eubacteriales bacterium]|nr:putative DNA binding domain-containing protein [Eubacteriales bacterium]